jgi:hypothetical protein
VGVANTKEEQATLTPTPLPTPIPEVLKRRDVPLLPTATPDTPLAIVNTSVTQETGLCRFQVTLKTRDNEAGRQVFYNWMCKLGLTDEPIATL